MKLCLALGAKVCAIRVNLRCGWCLPWFGCFADRIKTSMFRFYGDVRWV